MRTHMQKVMDYLRKQETARLKRIQAAIQRLTPRERRIVGEAAVMGFVQGMMAAGVTLDDAMPDDETIVLRVFNGIISTPDLYPTLSATTPPEERQ